jgi:hypothetical protein
MAARKRPASLAAFLVTRGLSLILIEVFVISTAFTFSPLGIEQLGGRTMLILQVLWAIQQPEQPTKPNSVIALGA